MADIEPQYNDCGSYCPNENKYLPQFCDSCPIREAKDSFKEFTQSELSEKPQTKDTWQYYSFDYLYAQLLNVIEFQEIPRRERTIKIHSLIKAFKSVEAEVEKNDRFNTRKENV